MKRTVIWFLVMVMCLSITACGSEDVEKTSNQKQEENEGKKDAPEDNIAEESEEVEAETDVEEVVIVEDKTPVITDGELQTIADVCEFYVDYANITRSVLPPYPGDWYSYYDAENGKVYVDICVSYKNLETTNAEADKVLSGTLNYGGKYEYSGFSIIEEENRSDFTYSNITSIAPLSTEYVHYLFEVPEEVESSGLSVDITLVVDGEKYKYIVREGGKGSAETDASGTEKSSGAVAVGEVIATKNAEFCVDYADISQVVKPPQPGDWYSYYEAENGKVYVDFCVSYKNLTGHDKMADEVMSAKLQYAGKYDYTGFSMIEEESRSDFTYSNITSIAPLSTEYVHYLFEVPEEVSTSDEAIDISFVIDGNSYTYKVRP